MLKIFLLISLIVSFLLNVSAQTNQSKEPCPYWETCVYANFQVDSFFVSDDYIENLSRTITDSCAYSREIFQGRNRVMVPVRIYIDAEGFVKDIIILRNHSPELDSEVLRVSELLTKDMQFKPAIKDGVKVIVYFEFPVYFEQKP
jgi:outer membrane biosynthesis protein TonB